MLGFALTILVILFPVLALAGRLGQKLIGFSMLLVFLTIIQAILPSLRGNIPWIAALHPVNALALMGISATIRRFGRAEALQKAAAAGPIECFTLTLTSFGMRTLRLQGGPATFLFSTAAQSPMPP
jgi:hypothetical protein